MRQHREVRVRWIAIIFCLLAICPGLVAQSVPEDREKAIADIEQRLQELKQAVEELRRSTEGQREQGAGDTPAPEANAGAARTVADSRDPIARIRDEGMNRSQVMQTLSYLTDVIGPRLTGSPNLKRANEWTRDQLSTWGLVDAHLEPWGPFGRGWSLRRFSAQIIEPQAIPLIGQPKAWSPGFDKPVIAEVVHLDARTEADFEERREKLKGAIVLLGAVREVQARFEPPAVRVTEERLLQLANAGEGNVSPLGQARAISATERRALLAAGTGGRLPGGAATTQPATTPVQRTPRGLSTGRILSLLTKAEAALVVTPSTRGDGGTFFIGAASLPEPQARGPSGTRGGARPWSADAPDTLPQVVLAAEDYNRLVRMIQQGEKLTMEVDLQVQFHDSELMAYNTIAEIPGGDLKDEIVMLGAHLDSWHAGTGATDNGAGVAAVMEAVRILKALKLQPRRTIRIALWTGEEQGLHGSRAYVRERFGYFADAPEQPAERTSDGESDGPTTQPASPASRPARHLVRHAEYDKLSAYFNLDHGTGRIRGIYMQGNEAVRPIFRQWLAPFSDLEAQTLTLAGTGGTDHVSFDSVGLPGFQFIQDPIEYWSRTHHSNADVYDRIQADDLKQAATILAAFTYNAAMADEKLPRKKEQ